MAYHLISIGVSNYSNANYHNLSYTTDDAAEFSNLLRQNINLDLDVLLRDGEASLVEINTALSSDVLKNATSKDTFILFFSGHGGAALTGGDNYEAYLVPHDGNDDLDVSGISTSQVQQLLAELKHGTKIVLLDCCYSGGANAKSISTVRFKDINTIKAFQNQTFAEGTFVFTACKEDERAIETDDLKHGLFTYYLLEEMSKDREGDSLPLSDICHPVVESVVKAAEKHSHKQTPTLALNSKGSVTLPPLRKPKPIKPGLIKIPTSSQADETPVAPPEIEISDRKSKELLNETLVLVDNVRRSKLHALVFRSTLQKVTESLKEVYEQQPKQVRAREELDKFVTELEAQSYQLLVFSASVALTGDESALRIYCQNVSRILTWKNGKSGLVAALETPDVIMSAIVYIFTLIALYTEDYKPLNALLKTVCTDSQRDRTFRVVDAYQIHYADALGGNAMDIFKHMTGFIKNQKWLQELFGVGEKELEDMTMQANMLICVATTHLAELIYPSFGGYYPDRIAAYADLITNDERIQKELALLLGCKPEEVRFIFARIFKDFIEKVSKGFFWDSIGYKRFLKDGEDVKGYSDA